MLTRWKTEAVKSFSQLFEKKSFKTEQMKKQYEEKIDELYKQNIAIVQMDSVIGVKGGKCLLTIHFVECSLMSAFLGGANTSKSVTDVFNHLDKVLGQELFSELFPVILTDDGSEFSNPRVIEYRDPCILL